MNIYTTIKVFLLCFMVVSPVFIFKPFKHNKKTHSAEGAGGLAPLTLMRARMSSALLLLLFRHLLRSDNVQTEYCKPMHFSSSFITEQLLYKLF